MDKKEILRLADNLWKESILANSYFSIIKQYSENYNKFYDEMRYSSAFYSITYNALQEALFMILSKLYDTHRNAINIRYLLQECKENINLFPKYRKIEEIEVDGIKRNIKVPFRHEIKPDEECFFKEEVENQKQIQELFGENIEDMPIVIDITAQGCIDLYEKKFRVLKTEIVPGLITQRNKIYAHNDKEVCFDIEKVISKNPMYYNDIQKLIEYALDVSRFIIGYLDNVCKPEQFVNINDWEGTLRLVQVGNKYKDVEIIATTKDFV